MESSNERCSAFVVAAFLAVLPAGCAHGKMHPPSPRAGLKAAAEAAGKKDAGKFYAMLSKEEKIGAGKEEIEKIMQTDREEMAELISMLSDPGSVLVEAVVALDRTKKIKFVLENGEWKIDEGLLDPSGTATPGEACEKLRLRLLALRSSIREEDILSESYRKTEVEKLEKLIEELTTLNTRDIVITDDHAAVAFPSGRRIEFAFEEGEWKIMRIFPFP